MPSRLFQRIMAPSLAVLLALMRWCRALVRHLTSKAHISPRVGSQESSTNLHSTRSSQISCMGPYPNRPLVKPPPDGEELVTDDNPELFGASAGSSTLEARVYDQVGNVLRHAPANFRPCTSSLRLLLLAHGMTRKFGGGLWCNVSLFMR